MTAIVTETSRLEPHRFTVAEYHRIYESGALPREPRRSAAPLFAPKVFLDWFLALEDQP